MADADQLMQSFAMVGATFTGAVAVIVAWGKARELASKPLEDLKVELKADLSAIKADVSALRKDVDALNVHFDPKGGDVRGKLAGIERRLGTIDASAASERAELKGLINDLKPILQELRERT
jgi:hypothetical protein